jgi:hypothetical protein
MPISRVFRTEADADAAVHDLEEAGFWTTGITVLRSGAGTISAAELQTHGLTEERAAHYAQRVAAGGAVVIVDPPFGWAVRANQILARPRGGDSEDAPADVHDVDTAHWNEAAPLSDALGLPILSHDPAPLSRLLGMSTLSANQRGGAGLSHNPAPLSHALGLKVLSTSAAPLSSLLGLPTLSRKAAPLSSAIGFRTLSGNATPLSSAMGLGVLSKNPAPLSSAVGAPTLTKEQ